MRRTRTARGRGAEPSATLAADTEAVALPVSLCVQERPYTCGPASLRIVLASLGRDVGESDLEALCRTTPQCGTRPHALSLALGELGVSHEVVEPASVELLEQSIRTLHLCIVDYQAWGRQGRDFENLRTGHYSVAFGFDASHLLLADPAKKNVSERTTWGMRRLRKDLFERRWRDRTRDGLETFRWMLRVPLSQRRGDGES